MIAGVSAWLRAKLKSGRASRLPIGGAAVAVFAALLASAAVENIAFLFNTNQYFADAEVASFAPAEPQDPDVVIVAITEDTLAQFPYRAPIDRQFLADLLNDLAAKGPRAIGIDVLFDQATEPEKDEALRNALASLKIPVRIAYSETSGVVVSAEQKAFLNSFVPKDMRALATLAEDQLDVVRWIFPGQTVEDGTYLMGLSRSLADAVGVKTTGEQAPMAWRGRPNAVDPAFPEFPAHALKVLPASLFKDKIVLIGSDLTLVDRHRTPFMTILSGGEGMLPGVVIQAHALSQLLHGRKSPQAPWQTDLLVGLLLGAVGAALGSGSLPLALRVGGLALVMLVFSAGGVFLFSSGGPLLGLATPNLSLALSFFAMEAISGSEARAQREFIKGVFSQHVAAAVVDQIISDPAKMSSLEGERRMMTFLFTDVADFTTMSESLESRELARVLNLYLEGMTVLVQKHGGMVDKFIGDAVFAIFNAPIDLEDHAGAAVRCALDMDRFSSTFSAEQNAHGIPFGRTRIGINTGTAVVGNFGSQKRHNYTASGDAVNTAARLEGLNKHYGTRISVSESTHALCPGIRFRPTALIVLKGKTTAIQVWEPLQPDDSRTYIDRYCAAYALLQTDQDRAALEFEALAREAPKDPSVKFHLERVRQGIGAAPVVMTEK